MGHVNVKPSYNASVLQHSNEFPTPNVTSASAEKLCEIVPSLSDWFIGMYFMFPENISMI